MTDRMAAIEWAWTARFSECPAPPWVDEEAWRQLYRDTRCLLIFLAATCDIGTGRVGAWAEQAAAWAQTLSIDEQQVLESIGLLAGWDLAYEEPGGVYTVQLPSRVPA
jgi:hypothetical protein